MEALFQSILRMSATGAAVVCVVLLLRLLLRRAPKRYSYWLWSAAAFRLVCPVSFRSAFSVFSLAPTTLPLRSAGETAAYAMPVPVIPQAASAPAVSAPPVSAVVPAALPAAEAASGTPSLLSVLGWVWLAGIALMLLWGAVSYLRLARRLCTAVTLFPGVWQSDAVDAPFLMGLLRPRIYIPFGLTGERLDYVLAHERFHIARRDSLVKLLAFAILTLHWFNPLVWLAFVLMGRDMEMRCDEAVLGRGAAKATPYSETLLSFASAGRYAWPGPLAFGESAAGARIKNVLRWKAPRPWVTVCAALLCVAAVAACAANPAERGAVEKEAPPEADAAGPEGPGAFSGVEGYLRSEILRTCESEGVDLFRTDGSAVRVVVPETEITELARTGALDGLAPEGELQSWRYRVRLVLAEDAPALAPVDGLTEESGRYVLERTHDAVALVYPNGRCDILYDAPVNDGMSFYGCHESCEEAIYDWYVTANGLNLPLYVMDWGERLHAGGSYPVRRFDGDGWYVYIPVTGWQLTKSTIARCDWVSANDTGSSFTIREASAAEAAAEQEYTEGVTEAFYAAGDGRYWRVTAVSDPKLLVYSSWVGKEPEIVQYMAESFRVVGAEESAPEPESDLPLRVLRQSDPARFTALIERWTEERSMYGEVFISTAGETGQWQDLLTAYASRWCEKLQNLSEENPCRCADAGVWELGSYLNAVSLTGAPRRLAFNVTLAVGVPAEREEDFETALMGWSGKDPDGLYRLRTEVVLCSEDEVHWTLEQMNSGGSAGWGWRDVKDSEESKANIRYALENSGHEIMLLRVLPNLNWSELSGAEIAAVMRLLPDAAMADESGLYGENDQLYRDLYMLWGFKRADGAFAELFVDGPDSILARQQRVDPEAFERALGEMDAATQALVRLSLRMER